MSDDLKQQVDKFRALLFEAQKLVVSSYDDELARLGVKKHFPRKSEYYDERFDNFYSLNMVAYLIDDILRYIDHRFFLE